MDSGHPRRGCRGCRGCRGGPPASAGAAERIATLTGTTIQTAYQNPVSRTFADTYAAPSVIPGRDGWWWAHGTTHPLREGESTRHVIPMPKSRNLVDWTRG